MTPTTAALSMALAAACAAAAAPPIADAIRAALNGGELKTLQPPMSMNLRFDGPVETRALVFKKETTADKQEHVLLVVVDAAGQPTSLVWGQTRVIDDVDAKIVDGTNFRSTLKGDLIAAVSASGRVGEVIQTRLDVSSKSIRAAFQRERDVLLKLVAAHSALRAQPKSGEPDTEK